MALSRSEKWLVGVLVGVFSLGSIVLLSGYFFFRYVGGVFDSPDHAKAEGPPPAVEWEATFGCYDENYGLFVLETEGGYLMAGITAYYSEEDGEDAPYYAQKIYLVETDLSGSIIWEKLHAVHDTNSLLFLAPAEGGGYIVGGIAESCNSDFTFARDDIWLFLLKVDSAGQEEWVKLLETDLEGWISAATPTGDGYLFAGYIWPDDAYGQDDEDWGMPDEIPAAELFLLKTDSEGTVIWEKVLSEFNLASINSVQVISGGGYLLAGTGHYEQFSYGVAKVDAEGNLEWESVFDEGGYSWSCAAAETADGGFIIGAEWNQFFSGGINLVKTDAFGAARWELLIGGLATLNSITATPDGGAIVAGTKGQSLFFSGNQAYICRVSPQGTLLWETYLGSASIMAWDGASFAAPVSGGGYIVTGNYNFEQSFLVKLKPDI